MTCARGLREIEHYGFGVKTADAFLRGDGKGKAAHWRLTELGYMTEPPMITTTGAYTPRRGRMLRTNFRTFGNDCLLIGPDTDHERETLAKAAEGETRPLKDILDEVEQKCADLRKAHKMRPPPKVKILSSEQLNAMRDNQGNGHV